MMELKNYIAKTEEDIAIEIANNSCIEVNTLEEIKHNQIVDINTSVEVKESTE